MTQAPATNLPRADRPMRDKSIHNQAARYAVLSVISFVGNLGLVYTLHEWAGLSPYLAVPIAMVCMTLFNFFTIRTVVFTDSRRGIATEFAGFITSIAAFRGAEYAGFALLHGLLTVAYLPAVAVVLAVSAGCKFLFLRSVVFAGPKSIKTPHGDTP